MAQYSVRHRCGHARTVALYGPGVRRTARLSHLAGVPCPACLRRTDRERAETFAAREGLPSYVAPVEDAYDVVDAETAERVANLYRWADVVRHKALRLAERVLADADAPPDAIPMHPDRAFPGEAWPSLDAALAALRAEEDPRFWIDHGREAERLVGSYGLDSQEAANRDHDDRLLSGRADRDAGDTPTQVVARLLLAACGNAGDRQAARALSALLRPSGAAVQRRVGPATPAGMAMETIERALRRAKRPYVAFSGGKDSLVVAHLVRSVRPDAVLAWSDDELEYPESVAYHERWRRDLGDRFVVTLGHATHAGWFRPWEDRPFWRDPLPGAARVGMPQDDWMAGRGHDLTFLGTRAAESSARRDHFAVRGGLYRVQGGTGLRCCPIHDWTDHDVRGYIADHGLIANAAYDRLAEIGVPLRERRIGPLPLVPRHTLAAGWPDLLERLEARYGPRWA